MSLLNKLHEDMKVAMKSGAKERLSVIRMLLNEVKNIDLKPEKPTEEQAVAAYAKKLQKAIAEFEKFNKPDEVAKLKAELAVAEEYLPKKIGGAEELEKLVDAFLAAGNYTEKQAGQAVGAFLKQHGSAVDGSAVNPIIRAKLAGK